MPDVLVADARPYVQYACDGVQTVFTYPFPILAAEDLTVALDDGTTPAGVSVDGVGADAGGTVTLSPAPAAGRTLSLFRDMPVARTSDFLEAGAFRASAINAELDRLTMMLQQVEALAGQAVKRAPEDADVALVLPPAAVRAGGVLAFDAQGQPDSSEAPSAAAARAIDAADASDAAAGAAGTSAADAEQARLAAAARAVDAQGHADAAQSSAQLAADHATGAQTSANAAAAAETAAEAWADTAEDVEVAAGRYSARHWAAKAAAVDMAAERRRADMVAVRARQAATFPSVAAMPVFALDFQLMAGLDEVTVSRSGDAYVTAPGGELAPRAADTLRIDHDPATGAPLGLLCESSRSNLLHDSFNPATQTRTLAPGTYTLSVHGPGQCALSGGPSGTATAGQPVTFTLAAQSDVTFTVSGSPIAIQCEIASAASSPIATPPGGTAGRQADIVNVSDTSWLGQEAISIVIRATLRDVPASTALRLFSLDDGTAANRHDLVLTSGADQIALFTVADGAVQGSVTGAVGGSWSDGASHTFGFVLGAGQRALFLDGTKVGADTIAEPVGATIPRIGRNHAGLCWDGHVQRVAVYPRALSDADLTSLTA